MFFIASLVSVWIKWFRIADKALDMLPAIVEHIWEMVSKHVLRWISMMLHGVTLSLRVSGVTATKPRLAYYIHSHFTPHQLLWRGTISSPYAQISFINPDISTMSHTFFLHIVCWRLLPEKGRFILSSLHPPQWALHNVMGRIWVISTLKTASSWHERYLIILQWISEFVS